MNSRIVEALPQENYKLKIKLENGSVAVIDMRKKIMTARFGILKEKEIWQSVTVSRSGVQWGEYVELTLSEAMEILVDQ